ncbi:fibropellin-3-like [Anneissia japonica]|uniref:fibropellin-3-like n=1 Tax=Anneissia japonica TaxID=1529436 RepID=UPI0014259B86|nr:fibropellin-3-like [Anneissia japonica]
MQSLFLILSVFATLLLSAFGQVKTDYERMINRTVTLVVRVRMYTQLDPCRNGAVCVGDGVLGEYTCRCLYGWAGKNCDVNTFQNCGYNLYENTGELISPNYPVGYGNNQNCHYNVRVHGAKQLTFTVRAFDTEFDKDALQYAPGLLWNFTGNYSVLQGNLTTVPQQFTIQGGNAWFVFESDRNIERPGFYITYQTTESSNCASNLCQNGAFCTDLLNDYICTCPSGFEGRNCEINVDNCAGVVCSGGKICVDGIDTYTCRCPPGYTGFNCKTSCIYQCQKHLKPKCGSDGLTYRNRCYLLNAKCLDPSISMVSRGACTNTGPVAIIGFKRRKCIQAPAQGGSSSSETKFVKCPATQGKG